MACGVLPPHSHSLDRLLQPVDRFDAHDSDQALTLANRVLSFAVTLLEESEETETTSGM